MISSALPLSPTRVLPHGTRRKITTTPKKREERRDVCLCLRLNVRLFRTHCATTSIPRRANTNYKHRRQARSKLFLLLLSPLPDKRTRERTREQEPSCRTRTTKREAGTRGRGGSRDEAARGRGEAVRACGACVRAERSRRRRNEERDSAQGNTPTHTHTLSSRRARPTEPASRAKNPPAFQP